MTGLVDQVKSVAASLAIARVPFALGGALALAYATEDPRGTRDIDVNVFVPSSDAVRVLSALPAGVAWTDEDVTAVARDGQVRVWWDQTPVDVFFAHHDVHYRAGRRVLTVDFVGQAIPVLAPIDLGIFKVLFDRPKDWVDLAAMVESRELDPDDLVKQVDELLGDDPRVERARALRYS